MDSTTTEIIKKIAKKLDGSFRSFIHKTKEQLLFVPDENNLTNYTMKLTSGIQAKVFKYKISTEIFSKTVKPSKTYRRMKKMTSPNTGFASGRIDCYWIIPYLR